VTVSRELARYKLHLVGVQEVKYSNGRVVAPNLRENTHLPMERGMRIMN
jgi:hypothetical protein